jgi:hypothetical protein
MIGNNNHFQVTSLIDSHWSPLKSWIIQREAEFEPKNENEKDEK